MKTKKAKVLATISAEDWAKIPELDEEKMKTKNARTHRTNSPNKLAPLKRLRGGALARAAVNQILLHPKTWNQSVWHNDCGTKHCFGGWCQILSGKPMNSDTVMEDAVNALGLDLTDSQDRGIAEYLFFSETTLAQLYGFAAFHGKAKKDIKPFEE